MLCLLKSVYFQKLGRNHWFATRACAASGARWLNNANQIKHTSEFNQKQLRNKIPCCADTSEGTTKIGNTSGRNHWFTHNRRIFLGAVLARRTCTDHLAMLCMFS